MRALLVATLALLTIASLPMAAAEVQNPVEDHDGDGSMEIGPVCVWGWEDACFVGAAECFQPYRRWFGIHCI